MLELYGIMKAKGDLVVDVKLGEEVTPVNVG
jgi:hypothetical protein